VPADPAGGPSHGAGRIVLALPGPLDRASGGTAYDRRVAAGLAAHGWAVELCALDGAFPEPDGAARRAAAAAVARAREEDALLVIDGLALPAFDPIPLPTPVAVIHHPLADETGLAPERAAAFAAREQGQLAAMRGIVVASAFIQDRLVRLYDVDPARIRVASPGVDRAPGRAPRAAGPPRLVTVGALVPRKGHDVLVAALARLADRPWRLACIGSVMADPAWAADIREAIQCNGLADRIEILPELTDGAVRDRLSGSDLFVLPSWYEGYGMALAEALAHGLPVVATTGGAVPGTVPAGAGVLVPPGDAVALAAALARLLDDPAALAAAAAVARAAGAALPGWHDTAAAFAAALADFNAL